MCKRILVVLMTTAMIAGVAQGQTCLVSDYGYSRTVSYYADCREVEKQEEKQERKMFLILGLLGVAAVAVYLADKDSLLPEPEKVKRLSFDYSIKRDETDQSPSHWWKATWRF